MNGIKIGASYAGPHPVIVAPLVRTYQASSMMYDQHPNTECFNAWSHTALQLQFRLAFVLLSHTSLQLPYGGQSRYKIIGLGDPIWNLTLEDCTSNGQGYYGPSDMNRCRNKVFITYVRVLLDLGVTINRLTLLDRRKISPYMMIMSLNKRRSLYMYPEFKCCRELFVCYDIGLIAPVFAHENDRFLSLQIFEVDESHVLYKRDLLEYLSSAPNLCEMRVVVPATWSRRRKRGWLDLWKGHHLAKKVDTETKCRN
ncbi:hypothetical protein TELCIR_06093, partial [Teladorsagia circumcincta]